MNLLDTLTRAADEEQLRLRPLPDHAAATQAEHLRRHYALLLAAVLTAQPTISEPQTRLLRLLLDALKLGDIRGTLFEQARELTPEPLLEAARLIREAGFAHHLVIDALVLLRLDAPLGDETARLAGELAAFFGLDESQLAMRALDVSEILGLNVTQQSNDSTDAEEDPATERPSLLAELWPSRLRQPLTREALRAGLQGGLWLLDANLDVDFPWQAKDAILIFKNGAALNSFAKQGEVKLTGCRLVDAVLDFQGACSITLERCDWRGDYDPEAKRTALCSNGQKLIIVDSNFSTRDAQTIFVDADLLLERSTFFQCGNLGVAGGGVEHRGTSKKIVNNCKFYECKGSEAGAIYMQFFNGISNCEFISCIGEKINYFDKEKTKTGIAVYSGSYSDFAPLIGCVFRENSIFVYFYESTVVAKNTQFLDGNVFYNSHRDYQEAKFTDCSFFNGGASKI